jgi:hypothetical protein
MRFIQGFLILAVSFALINLAWAGNNQDKKDKQKQKVLEVGKKGINLDSELNADDKGYGDDKQHAKVYLVKLEKDKTYQLDMISDQFDAYLYLEDAKMNLLAEDDDSGGDLNAQILFKAPADGTYRVICTSFGGAGTGNFTLIIEQK